MTEGRNKQSSALFNNSKGNLYECGFAKDVNGPLLANSGENPDDRSDIKKLLAATRIPDLTNRFGAAGKVLDMDRFITLLRARCLALELGRLCAESQ